MKDAHKVEFKAKSFSAQEVATQFADGKYTIPIPDSFEPNDCIFF